MIQNKINKNNGENKLNRNKKMSGNPVNIIEENLINNAGTNKSETQLKQSIIRRKDNT